MSLRRLGGWAQRGALSATHPSCSEPKKLASGPVSTASRRQIWRMARVPFSSLRVPVGSSQIRKCCLAFCVQVHSISFAYHLDPTRGDRRRIRSVLFQLCRDKRSGVLSSPPQAPGEASSLRPVPAECPSPVCLPLNHGNSYTRRMSRLPFCRR